MDPITLALLYGGLSIAGSLGSMNVAETNKINTLDQLRLQGLGVDRQINSQGKQIQSQYTQSLQDMNTQSSNYQTSSAERGIGVGNSASQINMEQSINRLDRWSSQATSAVFDQATSARSNMFSQEQQAIVNNNQIQNQGMLNIGMTLVGTAFSVGNIATQMGQAAFDKTIYGQAGKFLFQPTQGTMNIGGMDMPTTMPSQGAQFAESVGEGLSDFTGSVGEGLSDFTGSVGKGLSDFSSLSVNLGGQDLLKSGSSPTMDLNGSSLLSGMGDLNNKSFPKIESSYNQLGPITGPLANSFDLSKTDNGPGMEKSVDLEDFMHSLYKEGRLNQNKYQENKMIEDIRFGKATSGAFGVMTENKRNGKMWADFFNSQAQQGYR